MKCLNEMALINKNEKELDKKANFDANQYSVYVKGEGGYKKFPHFHIAKPSEGWDIRMNMDGTFHSIKSRGTNKQNNTDFNDVEKIAKEWVKLQNADAPKFTNGELAQIFWDRMN